MPPPDDPEGNHQPVGRMLVFINGKVGFAGDHHVDAELFAQFSGECVACGLAWFDVAAGETPAIRGIIQVRSTMNHKYAPVAYKSSNRDVMNHERQTVTRVGSAFALGFSAARRSPMPIGSGGDELLQLSAKGSRARGAIGARERSTRAQ